MVRPVEPGFANSVAYHEVALWAATSERAGVSRHAGREHLRRGHTCKLEDASAGRTRAGGTISVARRAWRAGARGTDPDARRAKDSGLVAGRYDDLSPRS